MMLNYYVSTNSPKSLDSKKGGQFIYTLINNNLFYFASNGVLPLSHVVGFSGMEIRGINMEDQKLVLHATKHDGWTDLKEHW
jgi:hypothetical protein